MNTKSFSPKAQASIMAQIISAEALWAVLHSAAQELITGCLYVDEVLRQIAFEI